MHGLLVPDYVDRPAVKHECEITFDTAECLWLICQDCGWEHELGWASVSLDAAVSEALRHKRETRGEL